MTAVASAAPVGGRLIDQFEYGLDAPICLTWELTYACNLACVHCLSSSGRRDPRELSTAEAEAVIDELQRMQVFYVNVGGGEPTVRPDFWHLLDYAIGHDVGVKFSTNGIKLDKARAAQLAAHRLRRRADLPGRRDRRGQRRRPRHRLLRHRHPRAGEPGRGRDEGLQGLRRRHPGERRPARRRSRRSPTATAPSCGSPGFRPSGRGADVWDRLHPTQAQQRELYAWLLANGDDVLTGDSFFHLSALGEALPGLNLCGAGRVVCLIDPVGDVYACPFAIHENFLAGNVRDEGGFQRVWQSSELFADLRSPQTGGACTKCAHFDACRGGCMAAKFFTGLPLDGPDPECVQGYGETALAARDRRAWSTPRSHLDHSHTGPVRGQPTLLGDPGSDPTPAKICDESPLAGLRG